MPMWGRSARRAASRPRGSRFTTCATRASRRRCGSSRTPPGVHCHKLRVVGDDILYVNSERLVRRQGPQRPHRPLHLRHQPARRAEGGRLLRHAGLRPASLRRRQQATARVPAQRCGRLEQARHLDARRTRPAQARRGQHLGPAVAEGERQGRGRRPDAGRHHLHAARSAGRSAATACSPPSGAAASPSSTAPICARWSWSATCNGRRRSPARTTPAGRSATSPTWW